MNQLDFYDLAPDDAVYTAIGSRLRYYRCLRGMNQIQLAEASGVLGKDRSTPISKKIVKWLIRELTDLEQFL